MNFLIFLIAFLMACDENTLTRVLHRPLAACTIFGAVLGNAPAGLAAGAVLEIEAVAFDAVMPSNYILPSLAAAVAAVNGGVSGAYAGAAFWLAGLMLKEVSSLISAALLPSARKAAETRKEGGLTLAVILSLVINGLVFGLPAMFLASKGAEMTDFFASLLAQNGWILSGLCAGGIFTGAVGIAVLMRNLNVREMPGVFLAGAAAAAVMCACGLGQAAALLCALTAFGAASLDYQLRKGTAEKAPETKPVRKGGAQWW